MGASVYIPTNSVLGFYSVHILTNTCYFFYTITILTSVRWYFIVVWFAFPWWLVMLNIFSCACRPAVCLLWGNVYLGSVPIFKINQVVWCFDIELYEFFIYFLNILNISTLSDIWFANVFSSSGKLPFCFVDCFLNCAKAFRFD